MSPAKPWQSQPDQLKKLINKGVHEGKTEHQVWLEKYKQQLYR